MAGDEDGVLLVTDEAEKFIQDLIPDHRIQSCGGLIQNQQFGPVGQSGGQGELHLHASGEFFDELFRGQAKLVQILLKQVGIPIFIDRRQDGVQIFGAKAVVEKTFVQHHADVLLNQNIGLKIVVAKQGDRPAVPADQIQNTLNGGSLAGTIFPNQSHNSPAR